MLLFGKLMLDLEFRPTLLASEGLDPAPLGEASIHYAHLGLSSVITPPPELKLGTDDSHLKEKASSTSKPLGVSWRSQALRNKDFKSIEFSRLAFFLSQDELLSNLNFESESFNELNVAEQKRFSQTDAPNWEKMEEVLQRISGIQRYVGISSTYAHVAAIMGASTMIVIPHPRSELWYWSSWGLSEGSTDWYARANVKRGHQEMAPAQKA
jgi:hypothetical protein